MTKGDKKYIRHGVQHLKEKPEDAALVIEMAIERGRHRRVMMALGSLTLSVLFMLQLLLCAVEH
jgi:hypothetical protein